MKVYVAEGGYDYEGYNVIGIFYDKEKAQLACDNDKYDDGSMRSDNYRVEEFEII